MIYYLHEWILQWSQGTAWEDIPEDFVCPECGVGKADFEMIEIG